MKTCYYCGTKYPVTEERCPLCGQTETEPEEVDEVPVELREERQPEEQKKSRRADDPAKQQKKNPAKKSGVFSTIVCIVLALAVIAGALFILSEFGFISLLPKPVDSGTVALPGTEQDVVPCDNIAVSPETVNFTYEGETRRVTIEVKPASCTEDIACEAADSSVVSVAVVSEAERTLELTAVGEGETEITVTCGERAASVHVTSLFATEPAQPDTTEPAQPDTTEPAQPDTTEPAQPDTTEPAQPSADASLSSTDFTFRRVGETTRLTVSGADGAEVTWTSSDPAVATVEGGKVTAVAPGMATITAHVGGKDLKAIARCSFEAPAAETTEPAETAPSGAHLSHTDVTLSAGETFRLTMWDGETQITDVTWSSANAAVADVSSGGTVTAIGGGTTTITGTHNGATYSCVVRCNF